MQNIVLAIGQEAIHNAIKGLPDINIASEVFHRANVVSATVGKNIDLVIVAEILKGADSYDMIDIILEIRKQCPQTRVAYLAGNLEYNTENREKIKKLAKAGVYDIHTMKQVGMGILKGFIYNPGTFRSINDWVSEAEVFEEPIRAVFEVPTEEFTPTPPQTPKPIPAQQKHNEVEKESFASSTPRINSSSVTKYIPEEDARILAKEVMEKLDQDVENEYIIPNLYTISSVKPGTGKSFLSTNIATAIAEYGQVGPNGKKPSVGLIEGDLQNLSIGTLLAFSEDKHNLKTAMEKIDLIIDPDSGGIKEGIEPVQIDDVDKFIRNCFKPYYKVKNMHALVGSQFQPNELNMVTGQHYVYLLEAIAGLFDVVIVDTNSSLNHVTTYPLLQLANQCYYVLNLDYNNIHNNHRYRKELVNLGIGDKLKYILNEDVSQNRDNKEKLIFGPEELEESGYRLEGKIPEIPKVVFLNRLHEGTPIILDDTKLTLKSRLEISQIADSIWPMDNLVSLKSEWEKYETYLLKKKDKKFLGLF